MNKIHHGFCEEVLPSIPSQSADCVITDPPYPEINRDYGKMTEKEWTRMMDSVVPECRRILKPRGSAVFILQSNSEKVGKMRLWLWEFMLKWGRQWGLIQDVYWWNPTAPPTTHCHRDIGLMRPSVKACVWLGDADCHRDQSHVLWKQSEATIAEDREDRSLHHLPSGMTMRRGRCAKASDERGGVTPFNLIPMANSNSASSAGSYGHGAGTPEKLVDWWIKYICPERGMILDPFAGSGTTGVVARRLRRDSILIEKEEKYIDIIKKRCLSQEPEILQKIKKNKGL